MIGDTVRQNDSRGTLAHVGAERVVYRRVSLRGLVRPGPLGSRGSWGPLQSAGRDLSPLPPRTFSIWGAAVAEKRGRIPVRHWCLGLGAPGCTRGLGGSRALSSGTTSGVWLQGARTHMATRGLTGGWSRELERWTTAPPLTESLRVKVEAERDIWRLWREGT